MFKEASLLLFPSPWGILNSFWTWNFNEFKKNTQVNEKMTHHNYFKDAILISFRNYLGIVACQACYHLGVIILVLYMAVDGPRMLYINFFPARVYSVIQ